MAKQSLETQMSKLKRDVAVEVLRDKRKYNEFVKRIGRIAMGDPSEDSASDERKFCLSFVIEALSEFATVDKKERDTSDEAVDAFIDEHMEYAARIVKRMNARKGVAVK